MEKKIIDYCQVGDELFLTATKKIVKVRKITSNTATAQCSLGWVYLIAPALFIEAHVERAIRYDEKLEDLL